jgi:hypothetical protein
VNWLSTFLLCRCFLGWHAETRLGFDLETKIQGKQRVEHKVKPASQHQLAKLILQLFKHQEKRLTKTIWCGRYREDSGGTRWGRWETDKETLRIRFRKAYGTIMKKNGGEATHVSGWSKEGEMGHGASFGWYQVRNLSAQLIGGKQTIINTASYNSHSDRGSTTFGNFPLLVNDSMMKTNNNIFYSVNSNKSSKNSFCTPQDVIWFVSAVYRCCKLGSLLANASDMYTKPIFPTKLSVFFLSKTPDHPFVGPCGLPGVFGFETQTLTLV